MGITRVNGKTYEFNRGTLSVIGNKVYINGKEAIAEEDKKKEGVVIVDAEIIKEGGEKS